MRGADVVLRLDRRLRRWPNINSTLVQRLVFTWRYTHIVVAESGFQILLVVVVHGFAGQRHPQVFLKAFLVGSESGSKSWNHELSHVLDTVKQKMSSLFRWLISFVEIKTGMN